MTESIVNTDSGRVLLDPGVAGHPPESVFDPEYWGRHGEMSATERGRGASYFVDGPDCRWVWRHFRRGGLFGRVIKHSYLFTGEDRVRSFAEWRLLHRLWEQGLPVPRPVAARYQRRGLFYTADLMTERLENTRALSRLLLQGDADQRLWHRVGRCIRSFHDAGVHHADLNAHNILVRDEGVFLIDFDRGRIRPPGGWQQANLNRLLRSLRKITGNDPDVDLCWKELCAAYEGLATA